MSLLGIFLFASFGAHAGREPGALLFRVIGDKGKQILEQRVSYDPGTLRTFSTHALNRFHVPYESEDGTLSIAGLGNQVVHTRSGETRYYNWCYAVDGSVVEKPASEIKLDSHAHEVTWFYAYSRVLPGGEWRQCLPADE